MWSNSFDLRLRYPGMMELVGRLAGVARRLVGEDDVRVFWDKTFVKPPASAGRAKASGTRIFRTTRSTGAAC